METYAAETLASAARLGITPEEAVHNLNFFLVLNAHGGFCRFLPMVMQQVGLNPELQAKLRAEVRASTSATDGGRVTMRAVMAAMPLVASTVYEALRFCPPVPFQ